MATDFYELTKYFRKKKKILPSHTKYVITPLGKTKAEELSVSGNKFKVMAVLIENGACSINEVADELNTQPEKIKIILRELLQEQYVTQSSQGG